MYKVIKRIANDKTDEVYEPGDTAALEGWPAGVLKSWVERGIIEPVETEKPKPKRKKKTVSDDE